ncbi:MAG TPA: MarR family transcriptional regulator [Longimicrobiales bacterium]|nr:MarR family transcriptional regulator [Longimicrobiales bacterium]
MLNINAERTTGPAASGRGAGRRGRLIREIRDSLAVFRAAAERHRVRRLLDQSVSLTHVHVLTVLRAEGPSTMGELAAALGVSVASATGIVSRMEERGLVERARSDADRRVVTVSLAPGGRAALDELEGRGRRYFAELLERLSDDELEVVRDAFAALQRAHRDQAAAGAPASRSPRA